MTPADRAALVDRLARARAWNRVTNPDKEALRRRASEDITEIEAAYEQVNRLGWIFVAVPVESEEVET